MSSNRYKNSEKLLRRALQSIPLGTQTFSKSYTQYPYGVSPYFAEKAYGSHLWDVDGNEYIDFINSLAAITLGYNDEDVNQAVIDQLSKGTIFSLSHSLEIQVAEKIIEMVPCAEMVRFGKNGSDVTAGAVRLARAYTGRDHIAVCGYHGWQDWYIGVTSRNRGVPESTKKLTHSFSYNDISALETLFNKYPDQIAAVILEPVQIHEPLPGYLEEVKNITHKNGALLIFDEIVTGFRLSNGGAQEIYDVIPDLATFGKGLANGYPLSAITGKKEYMCLFEEVFFSFTFGGDTISLAAAMATLNKIQNEPIIETMRSIGNKLFKNLEHLIKEYEFDTIFSVIGVPVKSFFLINDTERYNLWDLKTFFLQHMFSKGILILSTHNISYAHNDKDISILLDAYTSFFQKLKDYDCNRKLRKLLKCDSLKPLFEIR